MKRLLILFVILVFVGGGAALYIVFFSRGASVPEIINSINPFGIQTENGTASNPFPNTGEGERGFGTNTDGEQAFSLLQVSGAPATGFAFLQKETRRIIDDEEVVRNDFVVRFQDRTTGHVNDFSIKNRETIKISNTTLTQVQRAAFFKGANSFVSQRIEGSDIVLTGLHVFETNEDTGEIRLVSQALENNLLQAIPAPTTQKLFVSRVENGQYQAIITNPDGSNGKVIFQSPITEWWGSWINDAQILILAKPGSTYSGSAYAVTISTNAKRPLITRITGLEVQPSPVGTAFMYSSSVTGGIRSTLVTSTGSSVPIPNTLADKCAWSVNGKILYCAVPTLLPRGDYPDAWHQGKISFADGIFEIDGATGAVRRSFSLEQNDATIDAINLTVSEDQSVLGFMNKKDSSVWVLNITEPGTTTAAAAMPSN